MIIDCDSCEVRGKECPDCVVTFLTIPVRQEVAPVEMDDDQAAAVDLLVKGGLVPPLRLVPPLGPAFPSRAPQRPVARQHAS